MEYTKNIIESIENYILNCCEDDDRFKGMTLTDIREVATREKSWEVTHYGLERAMVDWFRGLGCNVDYWTEQTEKRTMMWFGVADDNLYWESLGKVLAHTIRNTYHTADAVNNFWKDLKGTLKLPLNTTSGIMSSNLIASHMGISEEEAERWMKDCRTLGLTERQGGAWTI